MSGSQGRPIGIGGPRLKVRVTENDINWAVRDDSSRCMVARALAREVDDAQRIEVDTQTIRFSTHRGRYAYLTPLAVQRYVAAFDAGDPIQPFEFTLRNAMIIKTRRFSPEEKAEARLRYLTEERKRTEDRKKREEEGASSTSMKPGLGTNQARRSKEGRPAPPRVFKTRARTYGHRLLRINQPLQPTALDEQA